MRNWTFDQLCLLAATLCYSQAHVNFRALAMRASRHGPRRTAQGVRAKRENLRAIQGAAGHAGLAHSSSLDRAVMAVRVSDPKGFRRHCNRLLRG